MGSNRQKHPRETLQEQLASRSVDPRVRQLKDYLRWMLAAGTTLDGMMTWLEERSEMGLFKQDEAIFVSRIFSTLVRWHDHIQKQKKLAASNRMSWEEKHRLLVEREQKRRQNCPSVSYVVKPRKLSLADRMAAGAELHGFE